MTSPTFGELAAAMLTTDHTRTIADHVDYLGRHAALTLNLPVADIGCVLSLLMDHGYDIEVNIGGLPTGTTP